jgi:hypothetical protein
MRNRAMFDWDDVRIFIAAARAGSLGGRRRGWASTPPPSAAGSPGWKAR